MTQPHDDAEAPGQMPLVPPASSAEPAPATPLDGPVAPVEGSEADTAPPARRPRQRRPRPVPAPVEPEYEFESAPAPVVTDEGVYGTLPPRVTTVGRLRDYDRRESPPRDQWTRVAAGMLAMAVGLWLVLYSAAQVTGPAVAVPAIERVVESMTGLRPLLGLHEGEIRAALDDPAVIPGFQVEGVALSRAEVQAGDADEWHSTLLNRTAEAIYRDGPEVLSGGEELTGQGAFSTPGGARLLMRTLSEANHGRATLPLWPVGLVALASAAAVLALGSAFGRFSALGFALLVGAVPPILAGVLGVGLVAFIGSDGSALAQETSALAGDLVRAPIRNGMTVLVLAVVIIIPARVAGAIFARSQRSTGSRGPAYEPTGEPDYGTAYD